jgi:type III pantothenate kinase
MMPEETTLDIDAGNTRLKWRLESRGEWERGAFVHGGRTESLAALPVRGVDRIRVANVASIFQPQDLGTALQRRYGSTPQFAATSKTLGGVTCAYEDPKRLGVDRWLAVVAARQRTSLPFVVAGLGTAATLDFVDVAGQHVGGYIVPGLHLMTESLLRRTADVQIRFDTPQLLDPGVNTRDGVNRGVLSMLRDFIVATVERFAVALGSQTVELFITGGDADVVAAHITRSYSVVDDLVLDGLAIAIP